MQSSEERAAHFLAQWNLGFEDLLKHVQPLDSTETLLLVGSIADGLANAASDIDLMIIGDHGLDASLVFGTTAFKEASERLPQGQEVNTEYWRAEDLERLRRRFRKILSDLQEPENLHEVEVLDDIELRLLHRLRQGAVLANPDRASMWRENMSVAALPDYLMLHWISQHFILREDAIAQVQEGDPISALWMLRFAIDFLGATMLASIEETNPYAKWRPRLLHRNRAILGSREVEKVLSCLFPDTKVDVPAFLKEAIQFSDQVIGQCLQRRPKMRPVMLVLNNRIKFIKHLEEMPSAFKASS